MWPKTELIDLLKIAHPIIQAPMVGASTPELVAAVSNAGGLGSYGGAATPPAKLRQIIRQIRDLTSQPFSVNLFAPAVEAYQLTPEQQTPMSELLTKWHNELDAGPVPEPIPILGPFADQFAVLLEEKIPVFSFHFGPAPIEAIREIHAIGSIVLATATTVREAKALVEAGVDVIIAQGFEAGGHRGTFAVPYEHGLIGTAALVPQVADAVSVPVVAAGGIMDARGIVAAFALGASGVQMGTAFLACPENNIPEVYRQYITYTSASDGHMMVMFSRSDRPPLSQEVRSPLSPEMQSLPTEELAQAFTTFNAYAGTYTLSDNTVTHQIEIASIPNRVGTTLVRTFTLSDSRVTLSTPPVLRDGSETVFELVWERI